MILLKSFQNIYYNSCINIFKARKMCLKLPVTDYMQSDFFVMLKLIINNR